MKNITIAIAALIIGSFVFSSCKKYEDGPALSIHTKKGRVAGDWEVEKYMEDGVDKTSDYRSIIASEDLKNSKDGTYTISETATSLFGGGTTSDAGTWEFINSKDDMRTLSNQSGAVADTAQIIRLTNKEMWTKSVSGSPVIETHYKAK
ncbi:MAG: hypothetical protein HY064_01935 [Bacteroidetes bacterium]|nr:hypothetical protein [Bacteroidota bacterium]